MTESLITGVMNFRDVGGLRAGNTVTRSGVLFRSGNLAQAGQAGVARLHELGVQRIVDLRADDEVLREPTPSDAAPIVRVPIFLGSVTSFFSDDLSLADMYRAMVDDTADRVVTAVRSLLQTQPVLVHCTVGKDRTGVTVALALAAAGVDEDAIIEDYARTEKLLPKERNERILQFLGQMYPGIQHLEELTSLSPAPVMRGLLADLTTRFGAPVEFLRANGLSDDEIKEASRILLSPSH